MKKNKKTRVVVAMSGGVDSAVAAALLKKQGYEVVGVFMQFWYPSGISYGENRCCSLESWREAQAVAGILNIPIHKVNFGRQFKKSIVDEFLALSRAGRTPNPCVACNKFIKFDLLLKYSQTVFGADYLATGHYVKKTLKQKNIKTLKQKKEEYLLQRPKDKNKDQTYFLYNLTQQQLKHLLFPLGNYTKTQTRALAKKLKLPIHDKPDSQEICFVGRSHLDFLKQYLRPKPGEIINESGKILGRHRGLVFYTLGQRSGIGLSGGPWYVIGFKRCKNQLIVSKNFYSYKLSVKKIQFKNASWLAGKIRFPLVCQAQIRYHGQLYNCRVKKINNKLTAEFVSAPRAATAGQSIVFYDGDKLLGGGIISLT